jgi:hypothetical protein
MAGTRDNNNNTVVVTMKDGIVRMVFNGEEDDPAEYGADVRFDTAREFSNPKNKKGKSPRGKNVRALLNCDQGTLEFDGEQFKIQLSMQQSEEQRRQQQQWLEQTFSGF